MVSPGMPRDPGTGAGIAHESAEGHVTGRARYIDDLPRLENEVVVGFVGSPCARGRILGLGVERAREVPGVLAVLTHRDLTGHRAFGPILVDEPFLPVDEVAYLGQPLVVLAANDRDALRRAREAVDVEIEEETPILTIEEALAQAQFLGPERRIERGDLELGWSASVHRLESVFESNGQEQLYFESQAVLAVPGEGRELTLFASSQNPTETQKVVAEALGWGQHQVVCEVRRMGGAFGGKETQGALPAVMAALVATRLGRPARLIYDKELDMHVTGKRHPYRSEVRVGFDHDGRIQAFELRLHSNGGAYADLSTAVLERSMLHADNAYYLPNVSIRARVCRTNLPPNTAFRGFGAPQSMAVIENVLQEIAARLGLDALEVRRRNLYATDEGERATTPYGQVVRGNLLPEVAERLALDCDYRERLEAVESFNRTSTTHLRGLAMVPVKFGICFTNKTLNQANALVNVYTDGTAQVSTGATEMGQGVYTKLAQIVADELGLAYDSVVVRPTSTERNNNTSPTAASASTDLNGAAAVLACQQIRARLAAVAASELADAEVAPDAERLVFRAGAVFDPQAPDRRLDFADLAAIAHRERIDLGARGFFRTPGIDFDRETGRGNPFYYYTTGWAAAEVLIDRFSGELAVERLDVLIDVGRMINRGIERGQVIGGLIQGIGWVTTEELVYDRRGALLSASPTTYKIPNVTDLPRVFNVDFVEHDLNRHNLRSTKTVGEPPLMLGLSVWAAIKHALCCAAGDRPVPLRLPATHEEVLLRLSALEPDRPRRAEVSPRAASPVVP